MMSGFVFFWIAVIIFSIVFIFLLIHNRQLKKERDDNAFDFVQAAFKFKKLKAYLQKRKANVEKILNE